MATGGSLSNAVRVSLHFALLPLVAADETAARTGTCQTNTLTPATRSSITHAVSSKSGGNSYTYDCNGNAFTRGDQTLIYDEENRLVEVQENSVTIAEYVYDGNGNRVKATVTGGGLTITTTFIGTFFEQTVTDDGSINTTSWKKYYSADAARLAMREDSDDPLFLVSDHLGSTSLVVDSSGQQVAKQSYLPYGDVWGASANDLPTSFTFTGQREDPEIGLMYYVARFYDPEIGHFIQADTIIPSSGNPTGWNRYAYANYNPINYNDPSGHLALLAIAAIVVGVGLIAGAIDAAIGAGALVATGVVTVTASTAAVAATTTATTGVTAAASNGLEDELQAVSQVGNMSQELVQKLAQVSTQNSGSSTVSLGLFDYTPSYTTFGANNGFTYLDMPDSLYRIFENSSSLNFW